MFNTKELPLSTNEAFFLTRIDSTTDIKGLLAISQMSKEETLHTISKFLHLKYISLLDPQSVQRIIHKSVESVKLNEIKVPVKKKIKPTPVVIARDTIPPMAEKNLKTNLHKPDPIGKEKVNTMVEDRKESTTHRKKTITAQKKNAEKSRKELAREHYNNGTKFFNARDYNRAIHEFEKAIENNPINVVYYNMLNEVKSLVRHSRIDDIYNNGVNAMNNGQKNVAIGCFKEALKLDQNDSKSLNKLAEVLSISPETIGQAEKYIRKAIDLDFTNPKNYVLLGRVLKQSGKFVEAKDAFETALEWDQNNQDAIKELRLF